MVEPPLLEGAVQLRVAVVFPGVAPRPVGAPGAVPPGCIAALIEGVVDPTVTDTRFAEPDEVSLLYHWGT
jgi:hypothetical protein